MIRFRCCKQLTAISCLIFFPLLMFSQSAMYKRNVDGVTVYPDSMYFGHIKAVQLQVINEKIIRVTASPDGKISSNSLAVLPQKVFGNWEFKVDNGIIVISTSAIKATINAATGNVSFADPSGRTILAEKTMGGRVIEPVMHEGKSLWRVKQSF